DRSHACASDLELEHTAYRVHLHPVEVAYVEVLVFGADADPPDVKADAHSVERIGAGLARRRAADVLVEAGVDRAALAEEIDRAERQDDQAGRARALHLVLHVLPEDRLRGLAEVVVARFPGEVEQRD